MLRPAPSIFKQTPLARKREAVVVRAAAKISWRGQQGTHVKYALRFDATHGIWRRSIVTKSTKASKIYLVWAAARIPWRSRTTWDPRVPCLWQAQYCGILRTPRMRGPTHPQLISAAGWLWYVYYVITLQSNIVVYRYMSFVICHCAQLAQFADGSSIGYRVPYFPYSHL